MAHILLIEDDQSFRDTLTEWLELKGHVVDVACDGKQGLEKFHQKQPDILITDIIMPNVDGMEVLFGIIQKYKSFPCKVIAMSGGGRIQGDEYLDMISGLGVDATLKKPFKLSELNEHLGS